MIADDDGKPVWSRFCHIMRRPMIIHQKACGTAKHETSTDKTKKTQKEPKPRDKKVPVLKYTNQKPALNEKIPESVDVVHAQLVQVTFYIICSNYNREHNNNNNVFLLLPKE